MHPASFLKGWFKDTLPNAPIERLALLRLDGDMYQSTIEALEALYAKVSAGGVIIVDDYGAVPGCRKAVEDFRKAGNVTDPLQRIDSHAVYWIKGGGSKSLPRADGLLPSQGNEGPLAASPRRNERCPCGSGLRFKHCHGSIAPKAQ